MRVARARSSPGRTSRRPPRVARRETRERASAGASRGVTVFSRDARVAARMDGDGDGDASTASSRAESINMFRNYEARTAYAAPAARTLPIALLTGFLGAGKTTLARRALENSRGMRVGACVNDFASVNVDARLIRRDAGVLGGGAGESGGTEARVTELTNGCACCALRDDLESSVVEMLRAGDEGGVGFDYALIETSGLVDPTDIAARLDRSFGPLTRARLDSVVCVVDAEIAAEGGPEEERDVWDAQLACADVVLLNKMDLLSGDEEKLARARRNVDERAPAARVLECVDADVPLPSILDVDVVPQPEGKSGHDWGSGPLPFVLSSTGGRLRKTKTDEPVVVVRSGPLSLDPSKKTTHFSGGKRSSCNSVAYETNAPLVFARFQHWATKMMPKSTMRSKGVLTLEEDVVRQSYDFHFSGKCRIELEPSVGELLSATSTCLVVIGTGLEEERLMRDIRTLEQPLPREAIRALPEIKRRMARAMAEDLRFEIEDVGDSFEATDALIAFRLTGAASNGFTVGELEESHGVDFNAVNLDLLRAVNASGAGECLLVPMQSSEKITKFGAPQIFLRMAVVSGFEDSYENADELAGARLAGAWSFIRSRAERVLERHISHIPRCKCGF